MTKSGTSLIKLLMVSCSCIRKELYIVIWSLETFWCTKEKRWKSVILDTQMSKLATSTKITTLLNKLQLAHSEPLNCTAHTPQAMGQLLTCGPWVVPLLKCSIKRYLYKPTPPMITFLAYSKFLVCQMTKSCQRSGIKSTLLLWRRIKNLWRNRAGHH